MTSPETTTAAESTRTGAADLMRGLGLLVDGPARWGSPIAARKPGVFVVELPGAPTTAPIEFTAVRRWLEHAPELTLDGEHPTPNDLARRIASFWLADEPVLFVGRSAKSVGQRVAAINATPLGDAKPTALGYWLKTLSVLSSLRVWWAETDAQEEYEFAILEEIAARNDGKPPFANLAGTNGVTKDHGLANALREPADAPGAAVAPAKRTPATRRTSDAPRRRRTIASSASQLPTPEPTYLSADGLERLSAELEDLLANARPQVIARVKAARELGDLRENGDYEYARKEQSFIEGRIQTLERLLRSSQVIDASETAETIRLGSTVVVEIDGTEETYELVGSSEANPAAGRLSNASPVGSALIGARPGDEITVEMPNGAHLYRVIAVR